MKTMLCQMIRALLIAGVPLLLGATGAAAAPAAVHPALPSLGAGGAAHAAMPSFGAGGAAHAGFSGALPTTGSAAVHASPPAMPASPAVGVNANATTHASAQGQADGLAVSSQVSGGAARNLDVDSVVHSIHHTSFEARDSVTTDVAGRVDASEREMADLSARAQGESAETRASFAKAEAEVRAKAKLVRADLKAATVAQDTSAWGRAEASLAENYRAYGLAVADAEACLHGKK